MKREPTYFEIPASLDKETFVTVLPFFVSELKETLEELQRKKTTAEAEPLFQLAHKTSGTAGAYGAIALRETGLRLTNLLRGVKDVPVPLPEIDDLNEMLELTIQAAEQLLITSPKTTPHT